MKPVPERWGSMVAQLVFATVVVNPVLERSYVWAVPCPGGLVRCPDSMTCCVLANKEYGCCPFPEAVCCPDHVHCCPHSMQCDVVHQACLKNGFPVKFFWKVPVLQELIEQADPEIAVEDRQGETSELRQSEGKKEGKTCPDHHWCPGDYTCCRMYSEKYGCCPFTGAECCSDGFHCCPKGSHCDAAGGCYRKKTNSSMSAYPLKTKKPPKMNRLRTKLTQAKPVTKAAHKDFTDPGGKCPDGHPCPEKLTCCKVLDQGYGCCPYSDAVCCTDYIHCCPKGTTCNTTLGTCDVQKNLKWSVPAHSLQTNRLSQVPRAGASLEAKHEDEVGTVCPDRRYHCDEGETCCPIGGGAYGCCPMFHATCCSDLEHCCPHGYECIAGGCKRKAGALHDLPPFLHLSAFNRIEEASARVATPEVKKVICPDRSTECPDRNTCCQVASGGFGCCPMPEATCCGDLETCCPHGYWCTDDGCERVSRTRSNFLPFLKKTLLSTSITNKQQNHPTVMLLP